MHSTPAHKQTDPSKLPGQIVNPIPLDHEFNHDMMDDMALHRFMNPQSVVGKEHTLGDYVARKSYGVSAEEKQAILDGQAFCSRVIDGPVQPEWKPGRDVPSGWDHV